MTHLLDVIDAGQLNRGTGPVAERSAAFVAADGVAFFDTHVAGDDRSCEIGRLVAPEGTLSERK